MMLWAVQRRIQALKEEIEAELLGGGELFERKPSHCSFTGYRCEHNQVE